MERVSFTNHYLNRSSIETSADNSNNSIELPQTITTSQPDQGQIPTEVDALIDNKMYRNKFRKLIREGHLTKLMTLAEVARTKPHPSRWFATVTAKANWGRTLQFLAKLYEVQARAERVAAKISSTVTTFIYKQIWRGVNVDRWADTAREVRHDKPGQSRAKYFMWLCKRELLAMPT